MHAFAGSGAGLKRLEDFDVSESIFLVLHIYNKSQNDVCTSVRMYSPRLSGILKVSALD